MIQTMNIFTVVHIRTYNRGRNSQSEHHINIIHRWSLWRMFLFDKQPIWAYEHEDMLLCKYAVFTATKWSLLPWIHSLASSVAGRLSNVSQPVKCGRFTEGGEGVTPRLAFGVRLAPGVSEWQRCHRQRAVWGLGFFHRGGAFSGRWKCICCYTIALPNAKQYSTYRPPSPFPNKSSFCLRNRDGNRSNRFTRE